MSPTEYLAAFDGRAFYALTADGKRYRRPRIRLLAVTNPDGSHYYRRARLWERNPRPGRIVSLEMEGHGKAELSV